MNARGFDLNSGWLADTLAEARLEAALAEVDAAERFVRREQDRADAIIRAARHRLYLAWCERNQALRELGRHPDQIASAAPTEAGGEREGDGNG